MFTRRSLVAATALLLAAVLALESRAEVAAETDAYGNYVRTIVLTQASIRQVRVWKVVRRRMWGLHPLNPDGDRTGDQFPAIAENPVDSNQPWVVWSRFNGYDYDLAWSRWTKGGWTPIQYVSPVPEPGDDLAPQVVFDGTGRPYLAWWREEGGTGRVYLSFFLVTHWLPPVAVSDAGVDSRNPRLGIQSDGSVRVEYQTASGIDVRVVTLNEPETITDDLNPVSPVRIVPPGDPQP